MREHAAVRNVILDRQFGYGGDEGGGWAGLELLRRQAIRRPGRPAGRLDLDMLSVGTASERNVFACNRLVEEYRSAGAGCLPRRS